MWKGCKGSWEGRGEKAGEHRFSAVGVTFGVGVLRHLSPSYAPSYPLYPQ